MAMATMVEGHVEDVEEDSHFGKEDGVEGITVLSTILVLFVFHLVFVYVKCTNYGFANSRKLACAFLTLGNKSSYSSQNTHHVANSQSSFPGRSEDFSSEGYILLLIVRFSLVIVIHRLSRTLFLIACKCVMHSLSQ